MLNIRLQDDGQLTQSRIFIAGGYAFPSNTTGLRAPHRRKEFELFLAPLHPCDFALNEIPTYPEPPGGLGTSGRFDLYRRIRKQGIFRPCIFNQREDSYQELTQYQDGRISRILPRKRRASHKWREHYKFFKLAVFRPVS